ncbi:HTH-type transcriptional regulator SrpS [compost metagenome]
MRVVFPIGINAPATATASGKALLAELSEEAINALLPDPLPVFTPMTLAREALLEQLREIKACGIAVDLGEYIEGLCSFAVLLDTYLGHYAIAIVAPSPRAMPRREAFQQALLACKQNIERAIGRTPRKS